MASKTFSFRMASEGAEQVIADLRKLAMASAEGQRALTALTQASPQLASVQDGVQAKLRGTAASMKALETSAGGLGSLLTRGGAIGVGIAAATAGFAALNAALGGIPRAGDEATAAMARLNAALGSESRARTIFQDLTAISRQTGVPVQDTAATFQRFAIAAKDIGTTNQQVTELVAGIQKFGIVSGASMASVTAATVQLGQALASGKLQGDELRSILENMPDLAQALAKEMGKSIGALRDMGAEGKLTSDVVMPALLRAVQGVDAAFANMPVTMARAQQQFDVSAQSFLAHIDQAVGASQKLAGIIEFVAGTMDRIRKGIGGATQTERELDLVANQQALVGRIAGLDATLNERLRAGMPAEHAYLDRIRSQRAAAEAEMAKTRAELLQINDQRVRQEEADFEIAQENRLVAELSASRQRIKVREEERDKKIKLNREADEARKDVQRAFDLGNIDGAKYNKMMADIARDLAEDLEKLEPKARAAAAGIDEVARAAKAAQQELERAAKDAKGIEAELDPMAAAYQRLETQLRRIREAVDGGFITGQRGWELQTQAYAIATKEVDRFGKEVSNADRELNRFFTNQASKLEDAIIRWRGFGNIAQAVAEDIARLLLRNYVTNPLANAAMSGAQSLFSWVGGLFSPAPGNVGGLGVYGQPIGNVFPTFADGGIMTPRGPAPLRRYAAGGIADNPQLALFGEGSMPEAYVPLPDGRSIPVTMKGQGGTVFNGGDIIVNAGNSNASPAAIATFVRQVVREEFRRFMDEINRGGAAAKVVGRRRA